MQSLARMALRPALLARAVGSEAVLAAAARPTAGETTAPPSLAALRHMSSDSTPNDALRKAERMVELMSGSPQMQQMMMAVMPAPMRSPEVLKQIFGDPAMRRKIAEMIASRGMSIPDHLLERMSPTAMDETFARAQRLGLDPAQLFTKLMAHPGLLAKLQQPRVMMAFLDIAEDPARQAKYEADTELLEVVFKVREVLGTAKPLQAPAAAAGAGTSTPEALGSAPGASSPVAAGAEAEGAASSEAAGPSATQAAAPPPGTAPEQSTPEASGAAYNPLVSLMGSDPKAARWLENPKVMAALQEVHRSPWKTIKYVFDRDVMEAFKDLKVLMQGKKP
ncbi:Protein TIC 40, chloroplastic [Tetrabaena socialis]|uniref:Protein TIC 40, chloroplastic n=1 Tax=Tetrabaena socialis TaxID=47790 RepID=A0A2J8AAT0_9CHLO|nr:Protein TIC 40, chloroplastic [Tetrabaena socialis]|eukprot:PNH09631.1 Protein TIC 40, chloroplastic [Tetrabaena socialis]